MRSSLSAWNIGRAGTDSISMPPKAPSLWTVPESSPAHNLSAGDRPRCRTKYTLSTMVFSDVLEARLHFFPRKNTSKAALSQSGHQLLEDVGVVSEKSEEQARRSSQDESVASLARGSGKQQEAWSVARREKPQPGRSFQELT